MKKTKPKTFEQQLDIIMRHYSFDPYNKNLYIKNCIYAITKLVKDSIPDTDLLSNSEDLPKIRKK